MKQNYSGGVINIVQFPDGEFKPLFVAADKVGKVIIGPSLKTWSNWRSLKIGPKYYTIKGKPYYRISDLEEHFSQNPVQTHSAQTLGDV